MSIAFEREGKQEPFSMPDPKDTHSAWKSKGVGYKTKRVFQNQLTTNSYEDSNVFDMRLFSKALVHIKELNVNAIKYIILGCIDASQWETIKAETVVAKNGTAKEVITDPYSFIKVQVKASVDDAQGKVNVFINGKTP